MQRPRPVFIVALTAAVVVSLASLAAPRVAMALPQARAAVPVAKKALQDRAPRAARALGVEAPAGASQPVATPVVEVPEVAAPADSRGPGMAQREVGGFLVPDFSAVDAPVAGDRAAQDMRSRLRARSGRQEGGPAFSIPRVVAAPG